jgi:hypothetical protein
MEACHRCGRRTAFRFWSWDEVQGNKIDAVFTEKVPFCTWFCARAHHLATGHAVEDDAGKIVFSPTEERVFGAQPEAKP